MSAVTAACGAFPDYLDMNATDVVCTGGMYTDGYSMFGKALRKNLEQSDALHRHRSCVSSYVIQYRTRLQQQ